MKTLWLVLPLAASAVASTCAWVFIPCDTAPLCWAIGLLGGVVYGFVARGVDDAPNRT